MMFRFVCAFVALAGSAVTAQATRVPDIHRGSVEIGWTVSQTPAPTGIPDPRFAEILTDAGKSNGQTWHDLNARLYWTRVMSTMECIVSGGRGFAGCAPRLTKDKAAIAAAGMKVYVHRHAFVSVNGAVRLGDAPEEGFAGRWQIGGGVAF